MIPKFSRQGWVCFAALMLFGSAFAKDNVFPYDIYESQLDNGLNVVTVPFDSPGIVTFYMVVRVGSREEVEKGVTGFAHFFEHCMFRGTEAYSKERYNETLQEIAAAGNANTWHDRTCYYFTGNADYLEKMFEIESDRFQRLKYSEQGFKTEAGAVLGEYTKNFASPFRQILAKASDVAFDKHTYKHTTMGFLEDIKDMPNQYEYSLKFYDRFYRPEYCTLMVVGDAKPKQVMKYAEKYFGDWKPGTYKPVIPKEPKQQAERKAHIKFAGGVSMLDLAYKGPAFSDKNKDKVALDLMLEIAFSQKSDVYKKMVLEEQKARFLSAFAWDSRDENLIHLLAQPFKVEDTAYVREQLEKTIEKFKTKPVNAKDLADVKSRLRYGMAGSFDTPLAVANNLATYIWLTGDPKSLNRTYELYADVTAEDIMRVTKKYFVNSGRTVVTLSGEEEGR